MLLLLLACTDPAIDTGKDGDSVTAGDTGAETTDTSQDTSADSAQDTSPDSSPDTSEDTSEDTGSGPDVPLADLAPLSDGACPTLTSSGLVTFSSNGLSRSVQVYLPDSPSAGMPVVVAWHGSDETSAGLGALVDFAGLANEAQAVVIAPEPRPNNPLVWDFTGETSDDLVLYDDLRTCLSTTLAVDLTRYSTFGFSAGATFATWLSLVRADTLSTVSTFSGGLDEGVPWQEPAWPFPALVAWGGETDVYETDAVVISFAESAMAFVTALRGNGQLVAACDHGLGHALPPETHDLLVLWNLPHVYGAPSPYEDGVLTGFPSWCSTAP